MKDDAAESSGNFAILEILFFLIQQAFKPF